jgi:RHS repeat-associated protein
MRPKLPTRCLQNGVLSMNFAFALCFIKSVTTFLSSLKSSLSSTGKPFRLNSFRGFFLLLLMFVAQSELANSAVVGATPGSFRVSESGAAIYTIPLAVPPGTAGMAPTLSLNYNSQSGNGVLGVGWSLGGLSVIHRCPATIVQDGFKGGINYDANDRYCLDGQRLVAVSGNYGADGTEYRTETESYTRIISYGSAGNGPASFTVWTKAGQIVEYGNTADSRIEAQGKATVRLWNVNKISDTKGNYIATSYTEDNANGEAYINRIDYTGNDAAGVAPFASVQFGYEAKIDIGINYEAGSILKNTKRINYVATYNNTSIIKNYKIGYEQGNYVFSSRMNDIQECSFDGSCLSHLAFTFSPQDIQNSVTISSLSDWGYADRRWWVDFNGDGKTDYCRAVGNSWGNGSYLGCSLSTGTGLSGEFTVQVPVSDWGYSDRRWWVDFNGDGKTDYCRAVGNSSGNGSYLGCSLSTGTGLSVEFTVQAPVSDWGYYDRRWWVDVNGDGKPDYCRAVGNSWGNGSYLRCSLSTGTGLSGEFTVQVPVSDWGYADRRWWVDADGDGKPEFCRAVGNSSGSGSYVACTKVLTPGVTNAITSISDFRGNLLSIVYKTVSDSSVYANGNGNGVGYPYLDFQSPLYVVSNTQTSDGIGGNYTTNYTYAGAKLHLTGGGFLGFRQVAANDPQTGITTTTTYNQNYPYHGLPQTTEKRTTSGTLLNSVQNTWQNTVINGTYHRNDLIQTIEQSWDLNGAALPRTKTGTAFDAYGNPTQITVATDDSYTSAEPVSPYGNVKTTTNTYANDTSNWLLGRLTRATVTSTLPNGATASRTSAFAYQSGTGLLIQETIEPDNASLKLVTDYTLDRFGNRIATTLSGIDITPRTSSTTYDTQGRFAIANTNALGHQETRSFDPGFGNPLSLKGPNGMTTVWNYDGFGRNTQEKRADGTVSTVAFAFCSSTCPANAVYYKTFTASGAPTRTVYFDSLNRELRTETAGFDGRLATVDKVYDGLGRLTNSSHPYYPGAAIVWTQLQYDLLGRVSRVTEADGGITDTSYDGLTTRVTNAINHTTQQTKNGLGQVVKTVDARGNAMQFSFDPFGNPVQTSDPNGNTVTLSYDKRGRKIAMTDPDMGSWTYSYDVLGQMLSQQDAKGQISTVSYDLLGRMVKRIEPGLTSIWTWDTAVKGLGKLTSESSSNGFMRSYAYDNYGRLTQTNTKIGSDSFAQTSLYDSLGRLSQFTQPTGFAVVNVYNSNGYLAEVRDAANQNLFWQAQAMDAAGHITLELLGNQLYTQHDYDNMGRPRHISTGKLGVVQDVQDLYLTHDAVGNLITRADYSNQQSDSFAYDELDRVITDIRPNVKMLNYQYDEIGNITFKTGVGAYSYGVKPHAVNKITGNYNTALQYDANGNQTRGIGNRTATYTSWNMPAKMVYGINTVSFDYDSNHERFRQIDSSGTTLFLNPRQDLGGHFEQISNASGKRYRHTVYAAGKAIAEVVTDDKGYKQTNYFHTDHLGSIDAITNDKAAILARFDFDPFGNRTTLYGFSTISDHGFTGHEHLPDVGLINMNGRIYDPVTARFLSADPSIQSPGNLQSYNRYSYVMNNPLAYTDPSGYSWFSHFMHSTLGKIITAAAVVVASVVTYGAATSVMASFGTSIFGTTATVAGATTFTASTFGGVVAGATAGFAGGFTGGFLGSGGNLNVGLQSGAYGALAGGIGFGLSGNGILGQMVGSGVNGYIQNGNMNGFLRGFAAGAIPLDLGFTEPYLNNPYSNTFIGIARDGIRGSIIGGKDAILRGIETGQINNAIGHLIGNTLGKYKSFEKGVFIYEKADGGGITFGNVVTGGKAFFQDPVNLLHERDHFENQFEKGVGALYSPVHLLDLTVGNIGTQLGFKCGGYLFEEHIQKYSYSSMGQPCSQ